MFSQDFFPTPDNVIDLMLEGYDVTGKTVLEPSAGKGNIIDYLRSCGAGNVIACEKNKDLKKILTGKCSFLAEDFLTVTADQVSHVDLIIMNPPFSTGEKHIIHAWNIAPAGCHIIALGNFEWFNNDYSRDRKTLLTLSEHYGNVENIGDVFSTAERKTNVEIALLKIQKPGDGTDYDSEFDGFFLDGAEDEPQENGIMSYNVVRDLVNRYVAAVKLYDEQLAIGAKMNNLLIGFYGSEVTFTCNDNGMPLLRATFKKNLQKEGWKFIFEKLNMEHYSTRGVRQDINKFIERQVNIPFTMKNIYRLLEIVVGTAGQRMDKALVEVFDKITQHHNDNRYHVEGWKTNEHYLVGKKFILPNMCWQDPRYYKGESKIQMTYHDTYVELMEDMVKALCYITGDKYQRFGTLRNWVVYPVKLITADEVHYYRDMEEWNFKNKKKELYEAGIKHEIFRSDNIYGQWFDWGYFRCKAFKKGSMHFEFLDEELWGKFNQRISKIKGFPLFEAKKRSARQEQQFKKTQKQYA